MKIAFLALFILATGLEGLMSFDWGAVAAIVSALALVISVISSKGRQNTDHIKKTVKEAIYEFREVFAEQLNEKFSDLRSEYIDKEKIDLRFQILQQAMKADHDSFLTNVGQLDHRIARNSEQISLLLADALRERGRLKRATVITT